MAILRRQMVAENLVLSWNNQERYWCFQLLLSLNAKCLGGGKFTSSRSETRGLRGFPLAGCESLLPITVNGCRVHTGGGETGAHTQMGTFCVPRLQLILGKGARECQGPPRHSKTTPMTRVCATIGIDAARPVIIDQDVTQFHASLPTWLLKAHIHATMNPSNTDPTPSLFPALSWVPGKRQELK